MVATHILDTIPKSIRIIRRISASSISGELTLQQLRILMLVHEGMNTTQIAFNMHISTAAVSKTVEALVQKKFITREAGDDRRCLKLTLTEKGDRIRKLVRKDVEKELEKHLKKLTKQEQDDLKKGLSVLSKLMDFANEK